MTDKKPESLPQASPTLSEALDTIEYMRKERVRAEGREAALREELAERKRKHLRSCQLAIGKSQLAKDLQQRLTVAEQLLSEWRHGRGMTLKDCASLRDRTDAALQTVEIPHRLAYLCLACNDYHEGSGNLPCPKMTPMSGVKP